MKITLPSEILVQNDSASTSSAPCCCAETDEVQIAARGGTTRAPIDRATSLFRSGMVRQGLRLEYLTVGWNVVEGLVSVAAAVAAGSVALPGFGLDSFVETTSGFILIWRLRAERRARNHAEIKRLDQRAHRLVAFSLFLLAAYVALDAASALISSKRPESTAVGITITSLSMGVMWWLARAKRRTAASLGSRALAADAFQATACWWLSLVTLLGIGLNAILGWWWADPVAALGMTYFLVREGRGAWRGEECRCR